MRVLEIRALAEKKSELRLANTLLSGNLSDFWKT